ncbi:aldolase/citrate lyase family protein [Amaricoccus sp.]|uniref:HpcH/HpaI aldolase family protein n=1 Tax=Amaricoccus sp. TaxID=1872485 RepID=UPI0026261514|nr:aldolase/citrate lyase family protein [Amaricoccus sp.]HRO12315.1 aldolase/citrate lyase family protein [Amaricoccus sp.]
MDTRLQIGCWIGLPSPEAAEIVGGTGFDFAIVDLEHGVAGMETAIRMMMALTATGTPPFVRIPEPSDGWIKRALDAGAAGVIVPRVEDAGTARRLAGFATYGPEGRRGEGTAVARGARWGRDAGGYRSRWRETGGLVLQIESPAGLAVAAEIAAVPGVTQLFFGPSDFSACLGAELADPRVAEAAREVARIARAAGREAGTVTFPGSGFAELAAMGYTHVLGASDIALLVPALDAHLEAARRELGRGQG